MDKKNDYQIKYTKLLLFISKLLYPKYLSCLFPLFMFYVYRIQHKLYVPRLKLYSVPLKLFDHLDMNENEYLVSDYQNLGLVSENHYKKIQGGLDLVKATSVQIINNKKTVSETKIIQILPSKAVTKNVLLISETLFFNITKRFYDENVKNEIILRQIDENPKFASKVVVSFVSNQIEYENSLIDSLLSNYFLTPKLLCENDVFEVPIEKYYPQILFANCLLKNEDRKFYFKCIKLTDERNEKIKCGFCVKGETELSQTHHVQSFAPQSFYKLIHTHSDDFQDYLLVHWPVGVLNVFHDMKQAIVPFLKTSSAIMPDILKPAFLIQGIRGSGKSTLVRTLSKYLGIHLLQIECPDLYSPMTAHIEAKLRNVFLKVKLCSPCLLFLNRFENFLKDEEGRDDDRLAAFFESEVQSLLANNTHVIILICSSNTTQNYPRCDKMFLETFSIEDMSQVESKNTLNWFIKERGLITNSNINLDKIVLKIHGFTLGDLDYLISEVEKKSIKNNTVISDKQFDDILSIMKSMYSDSIGAPKVPKVHWSDIGGLTEIKTEILKTIRFIMHYRHFLKDKTLKRSGILLYGPPGTGKTLIAKAVATECNLNFLSVKGPELLNMYVGQSESNVREVFTRARQAAPCIIFFDELDSLVPNRGRSGDSGGVMDRVVSQLLAEMDGIEDTSTIFIIGATNRPDLIDPGLLRPGRFDKLLYVGVSTNRCSKLKILKALTKKFDLDENTLTNIVDKLPKVVTGADIQAVCSNAWLRAARMGILKLETGEEIDSISKVEVVLDDFIYAIKQLKPSVTDEMLAYYKKMKTNFEKN